MFKKLFNTKTIIFIILAVCLLMLMPKILSLLMILFASFVLAAALNPFVNALENKLKNRGLSAAIIVISAIIALFALILPIIVICYKEIELFITIMPQKIASLYSMAMSAKIYGMSLSELIPAVDQASPDLAQNVLNQSVNFTMAVAQTVFVIVALTMFIYYILVDRHYLREKFIEFFPPAMKQKASCILHNITSKVGNYVRAQIVSMVAVGAMVGFVVAILGIEYPILLGLIAGILDIIPLLGPSIALALVVALAFPLGLVKVILAVILFLAAQQISNYVIRPFLFGKFMKLHPITILVSIFVAKQFLGVWGVIMSPAIAATLCVLVDELYLSPINEKEIGTQNE